MATSPYIEIILNGKKLEGPVNLPGKESTFEILEFYHQISAVGENEFTGETVREHKSIEFVKAVDSISTTLYKVLTLNRIIDKVIINWYRHDEKTNRDEVYFQHILERVKVTSVKMYMQNVKDKRYEHFPHLEKVELRYDWITFHYPDGNRTFKEQWALGLLLFGMNVKEYIENEKMLSTPALTDEMIDDEPNGKLNIKNLRWEHTDEQLKKDSPDTVSEGEGDTIKLLADFENFVEGAGVDFIIFDRSTGTKKQLKKIHTRCKKTEAEVEWEVDVSKAGEEPDIGFEVEARSLLKGPCEIAYKISQGEIGGIYLVFKMNSNTNAMNLPVKLLADDEELFSGEITDGILKIDEIPESDLVLEYEFEGKNYKRELKWLAKDTITTEEIIELVQNKKPGNEEIL